MSSTSIARQNRRMRQKQLPPILHSDSSDPQVLSSSSSLGHYGTNTEIYENASDKIDKGSISDQGSKGDDEERGPISELTGCSFINCDVSSQPLGKIFIEEERGFKAIDACHIFQSLNENFNQATSKTELAIDLAYKATKLFHKFSFLCHGLLGGMSFIETLLLIHLISTPSEQEETLKHFRFLSQPVHNIFNFLCIICCISAFDRYDVGNLKQLFNYVKKCKIKVIVIIIYPVCFLLSLSTANVDEKLCLPEQNLTISESFALDGAENELFYWKALSISKCVGAVLGWLIISLDLNHNLFLSYMKSILQRNKK